MNIYSKLLLGAAAFSLAACSSEEPMGNGQNPDVIKPTGDVAYLNVRLQSADSNSRADGEDNVHGGDYYYGDENEVTNAFFYFYDEEGKFVLESNIWLGPNDQYTDNVDYIEMQGQNTVVLTGLKDKNYPSYVVTVLNRPTGFTPGNTLAEMGGIILDSFMSGSNFIMTTSSYLGGDNAENTDDYTYFATKLKPTDFKEEGGNNADATVVDIYVERLAARVGVSMGLKSDKTFTDASGKEHNLYAINVSVSGETNPSLGTGSSTAATKVYVEIIGWELNSTATKTNLMKDLSGWNVNDAIGGNTSWWNKPEHHRSFWGKSFTYGKTGEALVADLKTNDFKWNELTKAVGTARFVGDRAYCNETTNTAAAIVDGGLVSPQYTPTVVLSAIVCDENGNALSLVNYQGLEYTKDSFIKRILSLANGTKFYTQSGTNYNQIDVNDVVLESAGLGLGTVKVALKDKTISYFKLKAGATLQEDGTYPTDAFEAATVAEIEGHFAGYTDASHKAIAKTDGAMYYTIPLTHLNIPAAGSTEIIEGQYGLVRNHIYDLSITKIKSLGEGVFDPENEEVNPVEPKNPSFYVESAINILSWKIVSQKVEL